MKSRAAMLSVILALGLLAAPFPSDAQQPAKAYRIGWLGIVPLVTSPHDCPIKGNPRWQAFVEGLRERGYIRGQNLVIECRYTEGRDERAPALAAELVSLKPDLIVANSSGNILAAKQATSTIPIVMVEVTNAVERGFIASLARPGGNITGVTMDAGPQIAGKRLQLLKEVVPKFSRLAVLSYLSGVPSPGFRKEGAAAAQALRVTLQFYGIRASEELEGAFAAMTKARADALLVERYSLIWVHRQRIAALAAQSRLPAMYPGREYVEAGGLLSYDVNAPIIWWRLASYVDQIFHGAKPSDLPVEQPTKFELVINLKTAKALGLTIPQSLLNRADEVIQ